MVSEEKRIKKTPTPKKRRGVCGILLLVFLIISTVFTMIGFFSAKEQVGIAIFYVKVNSANIRRCPAANCVVVDTFPLNSTISVPYKTLAEAPEWVEISYVNDKGEAVTAYISKTMLSTSQTGN